jgi:DNA-binding beta-propeller fold protein YncE
MVSRKGLAAVAAAAIAIGAGFGLRSAQSFTIPDACVEGSACAYVCSNVLEQGRNAADFIALAAYQLGPERPILMPPANLSMPAPVDPHNVYAGAGVGMFSPAVAGQPSRVYSPNLVTGKVDVIDPDTFKVIDSLAAMPSPEHIVPSWDLQTLWVSADVSARGGHGGVAPIDPRTGKVGKVVDVPDSYNIYFTPDGKSAIVVAEAMRRLEFRDPHTMALQGYISTPQCAGINHADFAPDGSYAIFTCEFNDSLAKIDLINHKLVETLPLTPGHMPQDIRVAPDGKIFFIADLIGDGVMVIDGDSFGQLDFIRPASARTGSIRAATARSSTSPTAAPTVSGAREKALAASR